MKNRKQDKGVALVILMVVIIIATLLGIWGLSSSRMGLLKAGNKAAQTRLQLLAEQGLQKALRRIQEITSWEAAGLLIDTVGEDAFGAGNGKNSSWLTCVGTTTCLCDPPPVGTDPSCSSPACPDLFGIDTDWDVRNENVICNFLGDTLKDTQVILVRKADVQATAAETDVILLVNSIAKDSQDRRQLVQGVIVIPYDVNTGEILLEAYIATATEGGD